MTGPSWKHRRRLIYASYALAAGMIVFAGVVYRTDTSVASQFVVGGVSLISIILTAYTAFATLDDKWHWVRNDMLTSDSVQDGSWNNDGDIPVYDDTVIDELFPDGFDVENPYR